MSLYSIINWYLEYLYIGGFMYPKLENKRNRFVVIMKALGVETYSLASCINKFLKGKDYLWIFMSKCFHI